MRVPMPWLWPSLAVGAVLGFAWGRPDPGLARVAELEAQLREAEQRVRVRTVLGAPVGPALAAVPIPSAADPIPWGEPLVPPEPSDPLYEEASIRQILGEVLDDPNGLVSLTCDPYPCRAVVIQRDLKPVALELQSLGFDQIWVEGLSHLSTDGDRSQRVFAPEAHILVFLAGPIPPGGKTYFDQLRGVTRNQATQELNLRGQAMFDAAWEDAQRESP